MKINTTNYEEYFLLYIDNELSAEQKTAVENFIEENPGYQKEFELLKQAVLAPEPIEFEDKILLYRLEEMEASLPTTFKQSLYRNEAKVVEGYFNPKLIRSIAAVAAIVIFIVGYNLIPTTKGKQNNQTELANKMGQKQVDQIKFSPSNQVANENLQSNSSNNVIIANLPNTITSKETEKFKLSLQSDIAQTIVTPSLNITNNENVTPINIVNNNSEINSTSNATNTDLEIAKNSNTATTNFTTSSQTDAVVNAKEEFENINTDNPNRVIFIANLEIDGDKFRGITRRISAFLKRNKTEKEK
jgi:hypothetical protein